MVGTREVVRTFIIFTSTQRSETGRESMAILYSLAERWGFIAARGAKLLKWGLPRLAWVKSASAKVRPTPYVY